MSECRRSTRDGEQNDATEAESDEKLRSEAKSIVFVGLRW